MIITFGNYKGGVGKTTATLLFTYLLSKEYKVLVIDTDPQANLTESIIRTYNVEIDSDKNIFNGVFSRRSRFDHNIQEVHSNLDILSGSGDMLDFDLEVQRQYKKENDYQDIIKLNIDEIKHNYDFILFDTAPAINLVMDNVVMASDYILITTKTEPLSYDSTQSFYGYLIDKYNNNNYNFELLGVLPYLVGISATDRDVLIKYTEVFDTEIFENRIKQSDRVKAWSMYGITEDKAYDQKSLKMYEQVVNEALERIKQDKLKG